MSLCFLVVYSSPSTNTIPVCGFGNGETNCRKILNFQRTFNRNLLNWQNFKMQLTEKKRFTWVQISDWYVAFEKRPTGSHSEVRKCYKVSRCNRPEESSFELLLFSKYVQYTPADNYKRLTSQNTILQIHSRYYSIDRDILKRLHRQTYMQHTYGESQEASLQPLYRVVTRL